MFENFMERIGEIFRNWNEQEKCEMYDECYSSFKQDNANAGNYECSFRNIKRSRTEYSCFCSMQRALEIKLQNLNSDEMEK